MFNQMVDSYFYKENIHWKLHFVLSEVNFAYF